MNATISSLQSSLRGFWIGLAVLAALVAGSVAGYWATRVTAHSPAPIVTTGSQASKGSPAVESLPAPRGGYETASCGFISVGAVGVLDC